MSKGDKYIDLSIYLQNSGQHKVKLTFFDVERILGFQLPASARRHIQWWANTSSHSQANSWLNVGYHTFDIIRNVPKEKVVFIKV